MAQRQSQRRARFRKAIKRSPRTPLKERIDTLARKRRERQRNPSCRKRQSTNKEITFTEKGLNAKKGRITLRMLPIGPGDITKRGTKGEIITRLNQDGINVACIREAQSMKHGGEWMRRYRSARKDGGGKQDEMGMAKSGVAISLAPHFDGELTSVIRFTGSRHPRHFRTPKGEL